MDEWQYGLSTCRGEGCEAVEAAVDVCVNDVEFSEKRPKKTWESSKLRKELNQIYTALGMDTDSSVLSVEAFADDLWTLLGRTDGTEPERPLWVTIHARAEEARALAKLRTTFSVQQPAGLGHTFASVAKTMQAFGDALAGSGLDEIAEGPPDGPVRLTTGNDALDRAVGGELHSPAGFVISDPDIREAFIQDFLARTPGLSAFGDSQIDAARAALRAGGRVLLDLSEPIPQSEVHSVIADAMAGGGFLILVHSIDVWWMVQHCSHVIEIRKARKAWRVLKNRYPVPEAGPEPVPMSKLQKETVTHMEQVMRATYEAPSELMGGPVSPTATLPGETSAAIGPTRRLSVLEDGTWCAFVVADGAHIPHTRTVGDTPVSAILGKFESGSEPADTEAPEFVPDGGLVGDGWEESAPIEAGQVWIAKDPDALGQRWTKVVVKEGPNEGGLYGVVPHDEPEYFPSFVTAESLRASMRLRVGGLTGGPADTLLPADIIPEANPIRPYLGGPDPFTAAGVQPEGSAGGPRWKPFVDGQATAFHTRSSWAPDHMYPMGTATALYTSMAWFPDGEPDNREARHAFDYVRVHDTRPEPEPSWPYAEHLAIVEAQKEPAGRRAYWPPNLSRWAAQTWWEAPYTGWVGTVDYGDHGWRWFIQPPPSADMAPYYTEYLNLDSPDRWSENQLRWTRIADTGPITSPGEVQAPAVLSVDPSAVPAVPVAADTSTGTDTDPSDPGGW